MFFYISSDVLNFQSDITASKNWCLRNNKELNINKCSNIFTRKKNFIKCNYTFSNSAINHVSLVNDVEVYFNSKLCFNEHINKIKNKAS